MCFHDFTSELQSSWATLHGLPVQLHSMKVDCACYEKADYSQLHSNPLVSVMLIVWNHAPYLQEAIDSVLNQTTNFPYEVVICEDCSPDNSRQICFAAQAAHPDKIRVIYREKNVGGNLNVFDGFSKARGQYLAWLEGDDYWSDANKLQLQIDAIKGRGVRMCVAWNEIKNGKTGMVTKLPFPSRDKLASNTYKSGYYHTSTFLMERRLWAEMVVPFLRYIPPYDTAIMLIALALTDTIAVVPQYVSVYRQTGKGLYTSASGLKNALASVKTFARFKKYGPIALSALYRQSYFAALANIAIHGLRSHEKKILSWMAFGLAVSHMTWRFNPAETRFLLLSMLKSAALSLVGKGRRS